MPGLDLFFKESIYSYRSKRLSIAISNGFVQGSSILTRILEPLHMHSGRLIANPALTRCLFVHILGFSTLVRTNALPSHYKTHAKLLSQNGWDRPFPLLVLKWVQLNSSIVSRTKSLLLLLLLSPGTTTASHVSHARGKKTLRRVDDTCLWTLSGIAVTVAVRVRVTVERSRCQSC